MTSLFAKAAVFLSAASLLASCSSLESTTKTKSPSVLSKKRADEIFNAKTKSDASQVTYNSFLPAEPSVAVKASASSRAKDKHGSPTYVRPEVRKRFVRTTAYSHMENEPGAPGRLNAAGTILKYGTVRSAAADWSRYPLGTTFKIKGLPHTYVVDDYGSALVGTNTIDIFHPTLSKMRKWGTRQCEITVIQWGDWERTLKLLSGRTKYDHCRKMYYAARAAAGRNNVASTDPDPKTDAAL
ncbi:MAG: 3D domain-containing protein [Akkermansiaceae bacterium]|nr:3D domain-containing protein [Akkermansiaceae bacterium]NNM31327.1 3D domain-containing protein [Akkermansiaceae bacterium]